VAAGNAGMTPGDIVSHHDICSIENRMLQHGMNFRVSPLHSVILMSQRRGAPYQDRVLDGGGTLIYEGHDIPRTRGVGDPKRYDQRSRTATGKLTPNGKFQEAAEQYKSGARLPEQVRVYEKVKDGIWTYNGLFLLADVWQEKSGRRTVFKFKLQLADAEIDQQQFIKDLPASRMIPSAIKREVFKRDKGQCVLCGSKDNLHFDHEFPFSKGGSSLTSDNIRILCARHNLAKSAKIE
jgi:hypothetical protein